MYTPMDVLRRLATEMDEARTAIFKRDAFRAEMYGRFVGLSLGIIYFGFDDTYGEIRKMFSEREEAIRVQTYTWE